MAAARERYSTLVVQREVDRYLREHQETSDEPKRIEKPVIDFRSSILPPQSASQYPCSC